MKKLLVLVSIIALLLLPVGCVPEIEGMIQGVVEEAIGGLRANYTIEVHVTEGLNFTGRYVVVRAAYDPAAFIAFNSTSYDVSGNASQQYAATDAVSVMGMFQKLSIEGTLEVRIWRGTILVDSANTTEPFGAVLVTAVIEG